MCTNNALQVGSDIDAIKSAGLISSNVCEKLQTLKRCLPIRQVPSTTIPMLLANDVTPMDSKVKVYNTSKHKKFSPFLEVSTNERSFYIRKTTAVWLFQESERVSSDRLFHVHCKQLYASGPCTEQLHTNVQEPQGKPIVTGKVQLGDLCVFHKGNGWSIGKVLQFSKYKETTVSAQQYKGLSASVQTKNLGVLCTWYE